MSINTFTNPEVKYPIGSVIPWHDEISNIPSGWAICDGNNGTPNLKEKFPRSVTDGATDPGSTGGTNSYTLSESQLPNHSHTGSITTDDGSHDHDIGTNGQGGDTSNDEMIYNRADDSGPQEVTSSGSHAHNGTTHTSGGGSSIDNQPKYEQTMFIKRLD